MVNGLYAMSGSQKHNTPRLERLQNLHRLLYLIQLLINMYDGPGPSPVPHIEKENNRTSEQGHLPQRKPLYYEDTFDEKRKLTWCQ